MKNEVIRDGRGAEGSDGVATASTVREDAHTPGPWTLGEGFRPFVIAPNPCGGVSPITIADCAHPADAFFQHQRLANARLIAAAPDLLAALKLARIYLEDYASGKPLHDLAMLDAAIAKAEGR